MKICNNINKKLENCFWDPNLFRGGAKMQFAYLILHEGKVSLANEAHFAFDDRKRLVGFFFSFSLFFLHFRKRKLKKNR